MDERIVLWRNGLEDTAARQLARALESRSKHAYFRREMVQAIAESQPEYFFRSDKDNGSSQLEIKPRANPSTFTICEMIVDYLPIYMYFQIDLSHNQRISRHGINALLDVANSESIAFDGLKELLLTDHRQRHAAAFARTSLY